MKQRFICIFHFEVLSLLFSSFFTFYLHSLRLKIMLLIPNANRTDRIGVLPLGVPIYILYCKDLKLQEIGHSEHKNVVQLNKFTLCESKVKAAAQYTITGIAART